MNEAVMCEEKGCDRLARYSYAIDGNRKNRDPKNRRQLCVFHHAEIYEIEPKINDIKTRVKYFIKAQKLRIMVESFIRNYAWMEMIAPDEMFDILKKTIESEKECEAEVVSYFKENPMEIHEYLTSIHGIADILAGKFIGMIDINDTKSVASLWRYVGYDPEHIKRRKGMSEEDAKKCGVPDLKAFCYQAGDCLIKLNFTDKTINKKPLKYRQIYVKDKARQLEKEFPVGYLKKTYNRSNGKKGYKQEDTCLTKGHAHMRALRKMMKVFLKDLFVEWKKIEAN